MKLGISLMFFFSLALGFLIVTQSAVSGGQHLYVSAASLDYYATNIEAEKTEIAELKDLLADAEARLALLENPEEEDAQTYRENLIREHDYYAVTSGLVAMEGPGVSIHIDDATESFFMDPNDSLVHDMDLLMVINELKYAGAEAISVNGQRIINSSSINCSGYTMRINGVIYATPFVIQAIGDSARMSETLIGPNGVGTLLQYYGLEFKMTVENNMVIPAYTGARTYRYTEIIKEGESN